ncbi:MAG: hypothetical protein H6642_01395 [Caldilineaceae bacterium]|nr:hypothetical protein [Caldilineaceae bacterium]
MLITRQEMITGENHFIQDRHYRLDMLDADGPASIRLRNGRTLELHSRIINEKETSFNSSPFAFTNLCGFGLLAF